MHAVVRKWNADPAKIEETIAKIEEQFVPELREIEGFRAYYTVRGENDAVFTITVCEDREGIEESTRISRAFVDRELKGVVRGPPEVLSGEVRIEASEAARGKKEKATRRA